MINRITYDKGARCFIIVTEDGKHLSCSVRKTSGNDYIITGTVFNDDAGYMEVGQVNR